MSSPDLSRLRLLLAALREPASAEEPESRVLEAFGRLWRASERRQDRRKRDRRRRAVLVEEDRRSGFDRRTGDRRKK